LRKIFINRRPVLYEKIDKLLLSLDVDNYILFFDVPPSSVDFNVTPLKDRVLLRNEEKFLSEIRSAVERKNFYLFQPPKTVYVKEETFSERLKVIGHNETIVLAEDRDYFYFLDIHLVHERVNYEMLLEQLRSGEVKSTKLLNPVIFDGDERVLSKFGIKWSKVNGKVLIKEIPAILNLSDIERLSRGESPENVASVACRRAIKSGEELKEEDLNKLLDLYLRCKEKRFCPHGRPIYYRISKREVYRNLGRLL
jgi:DNA mismatch repair protein MutL